MMFPFSSKHTIVAILPQKNEGYDQPIAFFKKSLKDVELKCTAMDKHDYALIKALMYF
jgi:hypothetical protein